MPAARRCNASSTPESNQWSPACRGRASWQSAEAIQSRRSVHDQEDSRSMGSDVPEAHQVGPALIRDDSRAIVLVQSQQCCRSTPPNIALHLSVEVDGRSAGDQRVGVQFVWSSATGSRDPVPATARCTVERESWRTRRAFSKGVMSVWRAPATAVMWLSSS